MTGHSDAAEVHAVQGEAAVEAHVGDGGDADCQRLGVVQVAVHQHLSLKYTGSEIQMRGEPSRGGGKKYKRKRGREGEMERERYRHTNRQTETVFMFLC